MTIAATGFAIATAAVAAVLLNALFNGDGAGEDVQSELAEAASDAEA